VALGYTLVYGIIKLINFAHGEFFMVGAYAGFAVYSLAPAGAISPWLAIPMILLVSGAAGAGIAWVAERVAYRPIRGSGRLAALLTAIGVSFCLQNLAAFVNHGNALSYHGAIDTIAQHSIYVGTRGIRSIQFLYIPASLLLTLGLWYIVYRTRLGKAMRATSQDLDAARLMGINTDAVISRTFVLGGFLAGVAGTLVALQSVVEPMMGFMPGLNAFIAAVVGGIGSIPGATIGGYALGIVQYLVVYAGVPTGYKDIASFALLILVLVIRPEGILGTRETQKV
jgi:branched-chain amino acid transport system permease protein